ncbi:hypothetical protein H1P_310018 [Hyella patelloides LEGE 07179]|uniref:Uncharacterized protein n=1 Tax=Hyella patelloides LEGE 07179 TaxID=945734 RepID=A0A563VUK0_9CYAN|nr:hypothetical protein H1P_310018 [Hyella patelloides LEGE 07179]
MLIFGVRIDTFFDDYLIPLFYSGLLMAFEALENFFGLIHQSLREHPQQPLLQLKKLT